eukprot:TRINITY_DN17844_c0_g1_i1.p1 TRINITY_DN17844_c0_g1~~TRINITY_DN17844_c0_g1_i1.p1  ORF type:complete len:277 (-),score=39.17 TRINITY_DN17844_c0_g1_i1:554-1384(-)
MADERTLAIAPYTKLPATATNEYYPHLAGSYDVVDTVIGHVANDLNMARTDSMELWNDPRFSEDSVIEKRMQAFASLKIISSLLLGTSADLLFNIKKDIDLTLEFPYVGYIQVCGFLLQVSCTFACTTALYVVAHQSFYTYRLMTAGPMGYETSAMFYLNKTITMWRHFAFKCLYASLWLFSFASGIQLFVKFYRDVAETHAEFLERPEDMTTHFVLASFVLCLFLGFSIFLCVCRVQHRFIFDHYFDTVAVHTVPLTSTSRDMSARSTLREYLDT